MILVARLMRPKLYSASQWDLQGLLAPGNYNSVVQSTFQGCGRYAAAVDVV